MSEVNEFKCQKSETAALADRNVMDGFVYRFLAGGHVRGRADKAEA